MVYCQEINHLTKCTTVQNLMELLNRWRWHIDAYKGIKDSYQNKINLSAEHKKKTGHDYLVPNVRGSKSLSLY